MRSRKRNSGHPISDHLDRHRLARRAGRWPVRAFCNGVVAGLWGDATRQHRAWRCHHSRGVRRHRAGARRRCESVPVPDRSRAADGRRRLLVAKERAEQNARQGHPPAAAGDVRPVDHYPERPARAFRSGSSLAEGGGSGDAKHSPGSGSRDRHVAPHYLRRCTRLHLRARNPVQSHRTRACFPRDLR